MIADALTKRHGNSVTMLKFLKSGQLVERRQFREEHGRVDYDRFDSRRTRPADLWNGDNGTALTVRKEYHVTQTWKPSCQKSLHVLALQETRAFQPRVLPAFLGDGLLSVTCVTCELVFSQLRLCLRYN